MDSGGFEDQGVSKTSIIRLTQENKKKRSKGGNITAVHIIGSQFCFSLHSSPLVFLSVCHFFTTLIVSSPLRPKSIEKREPLMFVHVFLSGIQQASAFRICVSTERIIVSFRFVSVRVKSQPNTIEQNPAKKGAGGGGKRGKREKKKKKKKKILAHLPPDFTTLSDNNTSP